MNLASASPLLYSDGTYTQVALYFISYPTSCRVFYLDDNGATGLRGTEAVCSVMADGIDGEKKVTRL